MTVGGFLLQAAATALANLITFAIYQAVVSTGLFKGIVVHIEQGINKIDPKDAEKFKDIVLPGSPTNLPPVK